MNDHGKLQLRDFEVNPTDELLEKTLGESYPAYAALQERLPQHGMQQEWQWYTPHKVWAAKGRYSWTTPRGAEKEKVLYWLHVFEGFFTIAVWFTEKHRLEVLGANVNDRTRQLIADAKPKIMPTTFPVELDITSTDLIGEVFELIECKKRLECT